MQQVYAAAEVGEIEKVLKHKKSSEGQCRALFTITKHAHCIFVPPENIMHVVVGLHTVLYEVGGAA